MSLDTYANLQTEVASWLRRSDLTSEIQTFISLAEAEMNDRLRVWPMLASTPVSVTGASVAYPADFLEAKSIVISATYGPLPYMSPEDYAQAIASYNGTTAQPRGFTVIGANLLFFPAPDQTYSATLVYYQKIPALSGSNASNWVLASHPDAYLWGALKSSAPFLRADDRIPMWDQKFNGSLIGIRRSHSPVKDARLRTDVPRVRPYFNIQTG